MKNGINYLAVLLICLFIAACSKIRTKQEYNEWLNDAGHNCIVSHSINGITVSVKYLPPSYLALKEISKTPSNKSVVNWDSLLHRYNAMLTFLMTIGPGEAVMKERQASVMEDGVGNYSDYVERVLSTNFFMDRYIQLYIDDSAYKPTLTLVENAYELSGSRNFIVVFSSDKKKELAQGRNYLFVYKDPFFNMGNVQFEFFGKNFEKARELNVVN